MGVAAHLQQLGFLVVRLRLRPLAAQAQQVEPGGMAAPGEAHQIRCGEKNPSFKILHGSSWGCGGGAFVNRPRGSYGPCTAAELPLQWGVSGLGVCMSSFRPSFRSRPEGPNFFPSSASLFGGRHRPQIEVSVDDKFLDLSLYYHIHGQILSTSMVSIPVFLFQMHMDYLYIDQHNHRYKQANTKNWD